MAHDYFSPNCDMCSWRHSDTYDKCFDENATDDEIFDYSLCLFARRDKPCKICKVRYHASDFCSRCVRRDKK